MGRTPDTMVNMEAWMVAGFNKARWLDTGQLVDAGPLGPQGRLVFYQFVQLRQQFACILRAIFKKIDIFFCKIKG